MPIIPWGKDLNTATEQASEYEITAEGVLTVTRRWRGYLQAVVNAGVAIRRPMPPFETIDVTNPFNVSNCLCVSARIYQLAGQVYELEEKFQGTFALPFSIYQWQTQRLDRPIPMHPRFNGTYMGSQVMTFGVDWVWDVTNPGNWNGFPNFTVNTYPTTKVQLDANSPVYQLNDGTNMTTATANPYRGIESYVVASGIWKRTSFTTNPALTGNLWYLDPPFLSDPSIPGSLSSTLPDQQNSNGTWIKSQEDIQNIYRGASELWQVDEAWWWNSIGWVKAIYDKNG